jgi:hypothetical protein
VIEQKQACEVVATDDHIHDEKAKASVLGIPVHREI